MDRVVERMGHRMSCVVFKSYNCNDKKSLRNIRNTKMRENAADSKKGFLASVSLTETGARKPVTAFRS